MGVQIVMDVTGDTRHEFDVSDHAAVALAEERFRELTGLGFTAATRDEPGGEARLVRKFDRAANETLFIPRLAGG